MSLPYHVQKLLDGAAFEHVDCERYEFWRYSDGKEIRQEHFKEIMDSPETVRSWAVDKINKKPGSIRCQSALSQDPEFKFIGGIQVIIQRKRLNPELDENFEPTYYDTGSPFPLNATNVKSDLILPWAKGTYEVFSKALNWPTSYVPILNHKSGIVESSTIISEESEECIGFVAQNTDYHWESWSLALSYNPNTHIITAFLAVDADRISIPDIISELSSLSSPTHHPLLIPTIMLSRLLGSSVAHYSRLYREMRMLEKEIDCFRADGCSMADQEPLEGGLVKPDTDDWSHRLNYLKKQQASRVGRHVTCEMFKSEMAEMINMLDEEGSWNKAGRKREHLEVKQRIKTVSEMFISSFGKDDNSNVRIDAQLDLLYNRIMHNEIKAQFIVSTSMKKDSSQMARLTWLNAFLLPPGLIASIFNINSFALTPEIFRMYMLYTVPFLIIVLVILYFCSVPFRPFFSWFLNMIPLRWRQAGKRRLNVITHVFKSLFEKELWQMSQAWKLSRESRFTKSTSSSARYGDSGIASVVKVSLAPLERAHTR